MQRKANTTAPVQAQQLARWISEVLKTAVPHCLPAALPESFRKTEHGPHSRSEIHIWFRLSRLPMSKVL